MKTTEKNNSKLSEKQKQDCDLLLNLGLEYIKKQNKENALKAIKCFEGIPPEHFPGIYKPMASSVQTNLAWFLIVDKNDKQAEIYLNRALEFGDFRVPIKLGHIKYLQNNFKEAVDFYLQASEKMGFIEEVIMEIQDDFYDLKVSQHNTNTLTDFLTNFNRDKTLNSGSIVKEPDESTPELTTENGYWKYSKEQSALLFSSATIKFSFVNGQKVIEDFDEIKKLYTAHKDAIETLVNKIMIDQNTSLLQNILKESNVQEKEWVWNNWSLCNVVEEQDLERRLANENKVAEIKLDVNEGDLELSYTQIPI